MTKPSPARQAVNARADRDGWTDAQGVRVCQCERCAEAKPVAQLRAVPVPAAQILTEGPTAIVCRRCAKRFA
ncbi:MAG TPA: hypothetical protein VMW48_07325 [Vicinamibacterales bacterium]|nr:hypothetical protein [Vicinamibacterales bacterium]